jgi:hypothetical protein
MGTALTARETCKTSTLSGDGGLENPACPCVAAQITTMVVMRKVSVAPAGPKRTVPHSTNGTKKATGMCGEPSKGLAWSASPKK